MSNAIGCMGFYLAVICKRLITNVKLSDNKKKSIISISPLWSTCTDISINFET